MMHSVINSVWKFSENEEYYVECINFVHNIMEITYMPTRLT